jgi:disulfide oxidoreductase YuzD
MQNETKDLRFDLYQLTSAIHNLNFCLIYQDLTDDNLQHYLKKLVETIKQKELSQYILPTL